MEQDKWNRLIVHWVNCLKIPNLKIISIGDLDVKIFYQLINYLDNLENEGTDNKDEYNLKTVLLFLKREYPLFNGDETLEKLVEEEPVMIASLLLHYSCIKTKDESVRGAMCQRLNPVDQKAIMFFANSLMKYENITPKILKETMLVLPSSEIGSPMSVTSSPGWVSSPATPPGRKGRRSRRLLHLEAALETERFDRTYLQEELRRQAARVQEMEKQHALYLSEIAQLRSELSACTNSSSAGDSSTPQQGRGEDEAKLRRELRGMEQELLTAMGELATVAQDGESMKKKVAEMEKDLALWRNRAMNLESTRETLLAHIDIDKSQISSLKMELAEKNKILEEYRLEHQLNESIECDEDTLTLKKGFSSSFNGPVENLGNAVIDVQLKEQINQNHILTSQIDELKNDMNMTKHTLEIYQKDLLDRNHEIKTLIDEKNDMQFVIQKHEDNLYKLKQDIIEKVSQMNILIQEKSGLEKKLLEEQKKIIQYETAKSEWTHFKTEMERKNKQNEEEYSEKIKSFTADKCQILCEVEAQKVALLAFQQDVEIKNDQLNKMATQISDLENNISHLKTDILHFQDEIKTKEQISHKLNEDNILLTKDNQKLQTTVEQNKEALSSEREKTEMLLLELSNKTKNIENHNISIKMLTEERDQLHHGVQSIQAELKIVLQDYQVLLEEKEYLSNIELNMKKEISQYNNEIANYVNKIKLTEVLLDKIENEKVDLLKKNDTLSAEVIALNDKFVLLNNEKLEIQNLNNALSEKLHISEKEIVQHKDDIDGFLNKIKLTEDLLIDVQGNKTELSEKNKMLSADVVSLNDKVIWLNSEKLEIQNMNNFLSEKLQNSEKDIIQYQSDIGNCLKKIEVTEALLAKTEGEKIDLSKENEILSADIISLNEKFVILNDDKLEIQNMNNVLSERLHNSGKEIVQYKNEIDEFVKKIKATEDLLANIEGEKIDYSKKNEILSAEIITLNDRFVLLNDEKLEILNMNNILSEKLHNSEKEIVQYKNEIDGFVNKIKLTEDLIVDIQGDKAKLSEKNDELSTDIKSLNDKLVILNDEKLEIQNLNNLITEKLKYFEEDCKYKSCEFATLQQNSVGLVETVERLKSELKIFEDNAAEQNQLSLEKELVFRENNSLKLQIDELQCKLNAEYDTVENIKKENTKIENDSKCYMNENLTLTEDKNNLLNEKDMQKSIIEEKVKLLISKDLVLSSLNKEQEALNLRLREQTSDLMKIKNQFDLLQNEIILKEKLIQSHEIKIQDSDKQISSLNRQLKETEIEKQEILNLQCLVDSLNIKLKEQEEEINNSIEKNTELSKIIQNMSIEKSHCSELNCPSPKSEEAVINLETSNVNFESEKLEMNVTDGYLQEISQLKLSIKDQSIKLKDTESKLAAKTNENDYLLREKLDLENCIDSVKLTLVGEGDLDDCKEIQPATFEDNSLEFENVLLANDESAVENLTDSGNLKMNSIKSKLTQLCNSTEMISKACAKNILQKDEIILKLTDEYNYLKEHNVVITGSVNRLQQKLYDTEEEILCQKIHYETQIVELETLREAERSENVELNHTISILKNELKSAKQEIELFEQNEKTLYAMFYSKIQFFSDYLSANKKDNDHTDKLKLLEDKLSKTWEVICEAVKRLKEMSLPIIDEIFPPNVQLPIMNSLKFLNSVHFDNSLSIFDVLATITNSIDYIDNYVDNLCKMIVSLVQDRITCRDSLKSLEKQNNILSAECQNYKRRLESTSRDKDNIARKLSEVELIKEKLEKSLNTSDAISSTTPCVQEFHLPFHIIDSIKKNYENISRLRNVLQLQEAHTKNFNIVKESLCGLNYTLDDFLGDKIALQNALKSHREIGSDLDKIETKRWMVFDRLVDFSSDLLAFIDKGLQPLRDSNEIDNTVSQHLWIINLEKQLGGIESESAAIQQIILELQTIVKNLETKRSSKEGTNIPLNYCALKPGISIYEQFYDYVEKYTSLTEKLSVFEAQKNSEAESLKEMRYKNVEVTNENNELINKVSALRKVLKELESKNNLLAVEKEELKYHNEQQDVLYNTEKDLHRKMMNENIHLKKQVSSLSTKMNDSNLRFLSELEDLKNENKKLAMENQKIQAKLAAGDTNQLVTDMRNEYEDKLTRMKQKMKQLYQDQIAVYTEKQKEETASLEALCKKYSEKIIKYEEHVNQLMNEQWKVGEKLLNLKKENDELRKRVREISGSRQSLNSITSTVSLPQARVDTRRNVVEARRPSRRPLPSPVKERPSAFKPPNKVESGGLHMSDEEGEVFDNTYLTELQSGMCEPRSSSMTVSTASRAAANNDNRLSELQWRNSLCLPHLKSSYPAELQYHSSRFREEDIKMGTPTINLDDSITVDRPRAKKEVGQTSYHKPGPPTPSKNGGRLSLQGNDIREPLKEHNECNTKKTTTPSRIKSLFMGNTSKSSSRDENTFGTPKGRRLSIFRKPR